MHEDTLKTATQLLLQPTGMELRSLEGTLGALMKRSVDYADLYLQFARFESWSLEDGIVKDGSHSIGHGAGVRAISGECTGFAYSDEITAEALTAAGQAAGAIATSGREGRVKALQGRSASALYLPQDPLQDLPDEAKVDALMQIDAIARSLDPRVKQVTASMAASYEVILVVASDGTLATDIRPLVRMSVSVIAEQNGRRERAGSGGGGRISMQRFLDSGAPAELAREAVRQAALNLEAVSAPAGPMTVVLGSGWPGVLLHEAVGHGLEGDFNRKRTSAFSGMVGQRVAAPGCTVVDDGTLPERRGSLTVDDEGTPAQCTVLIEDGILRGYMQDKFNARLMGQACTGNGRRESFAHMPMPRMTNTYMLPGSYDPAEIISSVERGLYAVNFSGGSVDITSGKFVFSTSEAYLIEGGKIGAPVKGATLIGNGPDVLTRVSMVGNDLALDRGVGVCIKDGQSLPVGVGQPTLRVDGLTVGGTA